MKRFIHLFFFLFLTSIFSYGQMIKFQTTAGSFTIKLYEQTPMHADNFIQLVKDSYYDGLLFHRVIKEFMIQTGDNHSKDAAEGRRLGTGGVNYTIPAEVHPDLIHKKGAVAAARMPDSVNPEKNSSGSQFYIVTGKVFNDQELNFLERNQRKIPFTPEQRTIYTTEGGAPHLDYEYTVFGYVIEGMETIEKIGAAKTNAMDRPVEDIKLIGATIIKQTK